MRNSQTTLSGSTKPKDRIAAIDQFRGFAILLMILADYLNNISTIPTWRTYKHFFSRNLALIGLGFLITLGGVLSKNYPPTANWGLLQALGAAGLITLPFIKIKAIYRWIFGFLLLALYQVLLDRFWSGGVMKAVHNGPQGALSWGGMLIIATSLGDIYQDQEKGKRYFLWLSTLLLILGGISAFYLPVSKHRASASYMLISLGLSGLILFIFHVLDAKYRIRIPLLTDFGKNPLLLYLLHGLILAVFVLPPYPGWYFEAPVWLVVIQAAVLVAFLSWIAEVFNRRGWYLTI